MTMDSKGGEVVPNWVPKNPIHCDTGHLILVWLCSWLQLFYILYAFHELARCITHSLFHLLICFSMLVL